MNKTDHKLGLTPMLKRRAFDYMQRGIGSYPSDHPAYDTVVVKSLYGWKTPDDDSVPGQGGVIVEFHKDGKRIRWVEFGCRIVGGGGEPVLRGV